MQAARLFGKEDFRTVEVPEPESGSADMVLQTGAALICGTDIRIYSNGLPHITPDHPVTLGHEISGTIVRVGAAFADRYQEGMRVAVAPNYGCGVCDRCVSGNTQLCPNYTAIGIHSDGGFAEFVRIPEQAVRQGNVVPLPDSVSFTEAAMVEPLSAVYNGFERSHREPGERVLIFGAGPIGVMHAKLYRAAGAGMIIMNDINEERLKQAKQVEPSITTCVGEEAREVVNELTGGEGVDISVTAAPAPAAQQLAVELTGLEGRVVLFGGLPKDKAKVPLDSNAIHYKQLWVTGITRQNLRHYREMLKLIETRVIDLTGIFTHSYKLSEASTAIENARSGVGLRSGFEALAE
jgi:L-iditol 2-dehydrogenase